MTSEQRFDIVLYRIKSAKTLLVEIEDHIERGYYNTAINRMYYACFYAVSALLLHAEIDGVKSHEGVRQMFGKHFILTGKFPKEWGRFYTVVYNNRSAADYEDFKIYDLDTVKELYPKVCTFIELVDGQIFAE
ncbi:MAG: HEPN domain-containing protein [Bacteroides sp.]|uniref:HEPN domain-containing protein n=1 Tax=Bacteroides sp. TaxID=29523 RepID=UPI0026E096DE|nr:HEPN domain-containing protein [Bacteroides sp.]MDO5420538.1 HEPN domain-containing protein [Bacteroides sp.]